MCTHHAPLLRSLLRTALRLLEVATNAWHGVKSAKNSKRRFASIAAYAQHARSK